MKRVLIFVYGVVCYALFLATFVYAAGFIGDLWVPKSMDSERDAPFATALVIDLALLALFGIQHSFMARPSFKRWWTRIIPEQAERSTYVLFSTLALIVVFALWQPLGSVLWSVTSPVAKAVVYGLYGLGWVLLLYSSFLINHFDLFGVRQVWLYLVGKPYRAPRFGTPFLYRCVRHPLYLGWIVLVWAAPTMTLTHLVFALGTTVYIVIGARFEEGDLRTMHPEYEEYRRRVPMLVPFLR